MSKIDKFWLWLARFASARIKNKESTVRVIIEAKPFYTQESPMGRIISAFNNLSSAIVEIFFGIKEN